MNDFLFNSIRFELEDAVGKENVSVREADKIAHSMDYFWLPRMYVDRGEIPPLADFIVYPGSAGEVSRVLVIANYYKIPVYPWGGGSGSQGGALPVKGGILLDTKRMNRVLDFDEKSMTVTVEAGMNLLEHLIAGAIATGSLLLSGIMVLCFGTSIFSDNFFLYAALFMFMRNKMVIADTTAYRFYSYLLVAKCVWELPRLKIRVAYLPVLFVFAMHCVFAAGQYSMRIGLNVIVDVVLIYVIVARVKDDPALTRRFLLAFLLGMVLSGIYGFTAADAFKDINVSGAGAETVSRNFGSLGDANYAGFFYDAAMLTAFTLRGVPRWVNVFFAGFGLVLLARTASISAFVTLAVLLSIPFFRDLPAVHGILLRLAEKLRYIHMGRWDLLTTDRADLWAAALDLFAGKSVLGKLFGGSVITYMLQGTTILSTYMACHQSYIQALLNFGILGTLGVFAPLVFLFVYRMFNHFLRPAGYPNEDLCILQLVYIVLFLLFGLSIDFFIDWTFLFFCFF